MDEMELIGWITRLKKTVSELECSITDLHDTNEDLRLENKKLQQIIARLPVEIVPRDPAPVKHYQPADDDDGPPF